MNMNLDAKKKQIIIFSSAVGVVLLALIICLIVFLVKGKSKSTLKNESSSASSQNDSSEDSASADADSVDSMLSESTAESGASSAAGNSNHAVKPPANSTSSKGNAITSSKAPEGSKRKVITGTINTTKYNLFTWSRNYWEGNVVYNESVYPMTTATGENEVISLLYDASKILEVRSSDLKTLYKEGKDYKLQNGKLVIPKGSAIKVNSYQEYYPSQEIPGQTQNKTGGGWIYFSEGPVFHQKQIAVTYEHTTKWNGPVVPKKGSKLPGLQKILDTNGMLNLVVFGDSISCGANASAESAAEPNTPSWPKMFNAALKEMGATVNFNNFSAGGEASSYGARPDKLASVIRQSPDLVVLGWGMNDGGIWHGTSPAAYKANIKSAMDQIRKSNPDCEFILVGTTWPNEEARDFYNLGAYQKYTDQLYELEKEYKGVAVASMTEIHKYILSRKNFRDVTGNNVNHPNDFISRLYLQVLLQTVA